MRDKEALQAETRIALQIKRTHPCQTAHDTDMDAWATAHGYYVVIRVTTTYTWTPLLG